jgi:hypothetical protein
MIDATEQIQTPAASEFPVQEVPNQPAATVHPEPQTPEPEQPAQDETALTKQIAQLWRLHIDYAISMRHQSQNLRSLRNELGKKLADMKQVLAQPGRLGKWSSWLKEHKISRSTADRLVAKHERSLNPDPNCPTESIIEPTEEEIQTLLDKVASKLRRALRTPQSAYRFVELLVSSLALEGRVLEEGLTVVKPVQNTALVEPVQEAQHEPMESPGEPIPIVADAPAECDGESIETSVGL